VQRLQQAAREAARAAEGERHRLAEIVANHDALLEQKERQLVHKQTAVLQRLQVREEAFRQDLCLMEAEKVSAGRGGVT
jgi:hypothetical protein